MPGWTSNDESIASFLEQSAMLRSWFETGCGREIARLAYNCMANTDLTKIYYKLQQTRILASTFYLFLFLGLPSIVRSLI